MSNDTFKSMDEPGLLDICEHLSKFGSFVYLWKTPKDNNLITGADGYKFFGIDPQTSVFTSDDLEKLIHPEDIEHLRRSEKALLEKEEASVVEFRFFCPDGSQKYVRQSQQLVKTGNDVKILNVLQDITEQK